jgi:hypothetical protein
MQRKSSPLGHAPQLINSTNLLPKFLLRRLKRKRGRFLQRLIPAGGVGAEIGVQRGLFSHVLLHRLRPSKLHLIDPWYLAGKEWSWALGNKSTVKALANLMRAFEDELADGSVVLHIGFDFDVLPSLPDGYFDWVYLDTSHTYADTVRELELLARKTKVTGIIAGDNWEANPQHAFHGVYVAVDEFVKREGYEFLHDLRDDARQFAIRKRT